MYLQHHHRTGLSVGARASTSRKKAPLSHALQHQALTLIFRVFRASDWAAEPTPPVGHIDTRAVSSLLEPPRLLHWTKVCRRLLASLIFAEYSHIDLVARIPSTGWYSRYFFFINCNSPPAAFVPFPTKTASLSALQSAPPSPDSTLAPLHKTSTFTSAGAYTPWNSSSRPILAFQTVGLR